MHFIRKNIDWQIWIQLGQYLVCYRKLVDMERCRDGCKGRSTAKYSPGIWHLSFNDGAFAFDPPPDAHKILLDEVKPTIRGHQDKEGI